MALKDRWEDLKYWVECRWYEFPVWFRTTLWFLAGWAVAACVYKHGHFPWGHWF